MISRHASALAASLACTLVACDPRVIAPREASWDDVGPLLAERCGSCHGAERAEGGYRVDGYARAIACTAGAPDAPVIEPADDTAAIVAVLARDDHATLLDESERSLVLAWVTSGARPPEGAAHPDGWSDPRSEEHHARVLRAEGWARMLDGARRDSCTRCHAGSTREEEAPDRARGLGATDCTSCHAAPEGPFACGTCHGTLEHAYPPRDACLHPEEQSLGGAHATHVGRGLACTACHGAMRTTEGLADPASSGHGDGAVDVVLDPAIAGEGATANHEDGTCTTSCHARGGSLARPRWLLDHDLDCGSCHSSPPADHYDGPCSRCHAEANADGTALVAGPLHANGRVDLGDGSGGCGACHGEGDDPWPSTGAHQAHAHPHDSLAVACADCHQVPEHVDDAGHLDRVAGAEVSFGARASARGATPVREGSTCREVACHGAGLEGGSAPPPVWTDTDGTSSRCGACHAVPPPAPHTTDEGCSAVACHGGYVTVDHRLSELGRAVHTNGVIDLWSAR